MERVWRKRCCESAKMSKVQTLRTLVNQRLTLAAEQIFELFDKMVVEYEEELCRQRELLNAVFNPEVRLHKADVQQLLVNKEAVPPEQQEWSPLLNQEEPPELPHIKEEQEELRSSQEGEHLQQLEEAHITQFTSCPSPVKSEDEEKPQSPKLHQSQTEENRDAEHLITETKEEDCGESNPLRNFNPDSYFQPATNDKTSQSSEPETDDSYDWEETRDSESGLNPLQNNLVFRSGKEGNTGKTSVSSSECATSFKCKGRVQKQNHSEVQTGVKPFSCSVCGKRYDRKNSLRSHMRLHSATNRFSCSVCTKTFLWRRNVETHMRIHTGEKPFSCSVCGSKFTQSSTLTSHLRIHTGEKPFTCSICKASFSNSSNLYKHIRMHSGEKPFSCSICGRTFVERGQLRRHVVTHTGEKPFSCSVCGKRFAQRGTLRRHFNVHTGDKPFSCSVCDKRFTRLHMFKNHKCVGESSRNK